MLNELKLDKEEFNACVFDSVADVNVADALQKVLNKFDEKVTSRRLRVKTFKKKIEDEKASEDEKKRYKAFIKKVEKIEEGYELEKRMIIRRSIMLSLESLKNKLCKTLEQNSKQESTTCIKYAGKIK